MDARLVFDSVLKQFMARDLLSLNSVKMEVFALRPVVVHETGFFCVDIPGKS